MAESFNVPLPEISVENFERSWIRFLLVAEAKDWEEEKQLKVAPTLLKGKLFDCYLDLKVEEKGSMERLKKSLTIKAGIGEDPLVTARDFQVRTQGPTEKAADFISDLRKKFKRAYPGEELTSAVLLQKALTGLRPEIVKQVLLRMGGPPTSLDDLSESVAGVEQALEFCKESAMENTETVFNISSSGKGEQTTPMSDSKLTRLENMVEIMTKKMEALESQMKHQTSKDEYRSGPRQQRSSQRRLRKCFKCGEFGHIQYDKECPLNYQEPTHRVTGVGRQTQ